MIDFTHMPHVESHITTVYIFLYTNRLFTDTETYTHAHRLKYEKERRDRKSERERKGEKRRKKETYTLRDVCMREKGRERWYVTDRGK